MGRLSSAERKLAGAHVARAWSNSRHLKQLAATYVPAH